MGLRFPLKMAQTASQDKLTSCKAADFWLAVGRKGGKAPSLMASAARPGMPPALALLSMAALLLVLAPRDSRAEEACGNCSTG
jgi:hypothetical protein